jgi:hypothetical protein
MELYKLGVTASDEWRCRQCGYSGRLITHDWYKGGLSSVRTYRGGFLRCPNPSCLTLGSFMKRRRFDQVARFYESDPQYDRAELDVRQAVTRLSSSIGTRDPSQRSSTANTSVPVPVLD